MMLSEKWHGLPLYAWYGGVGVLGGVGFYVWRKRGKAGATSVVGAASQDPQGSQPSYGGSGAGSSGSHAGGPPFPAAFGDLFIPPVSSTDTNVPNVTTPVSVPNTPENDPSPNILQSNPVVDRVKSLVGKLSIAPPSLEAAPVASAPLGPVASNMPAPPQPILASVQQALGFAPAPPGNTAYPIVTQGQTIGETFVPENGPSVTSPWQEALGLAPSTPAENAQPIIAQGQTIGESFTPGTDPAPPALFTDNPPVAYQTIYGPVTHDQWLMTPPQNRL